MMNIRGYLDSLNLRDEEFIRRDCPSCSGKNTFTATKEMGQIKYNCYKLDCNIGGYHNVDLTAGDKATAFNKRNTKGNGERDNGDTRICSTAQR